MTALSPANVGRRDTRRDWSRTSKARITRRPMFRPAPWSARMEPQFVIVYTDTDRQEKVYATAYGTAHQREAVLQCVERHGRGANVRSEQASVAARRRKEPWDAR